MDAEDIPDATESATGKPDDPGTHAPWSIKSIAKEASGAAFTAAKRNKVSVGAWLELAIRTRIEFEAGEHLPAVVDPPPPPATLDEIGRMIEMAKMLSEVAQKPPPAGVTQLAYRHLRERLTVGIPKRTGPARKSDHKAARV